LKFIIDKINNMKIDNLIGTVDEYKTKNIKIFAKSVNNGYDAHQYPKSNKYFGSTGSNALFIESYSFFCDKIRSR